MFWWALACDGGDSGKHTDEGVDSADTGDSGAPEDSGRTPEERGASDAETLVQGVESDSNFGGWVLATELGGVPSIAVGDQHAHVGETGFGAAFVYSLANPGSAQAALFSAFGNDVGSGLCAPGDLDGDGADDLVVGSRQWSGEGVKSAGAAYVVLGPMSGPTDMASSGYRAIGTSEDDLFGVAVSCGADATGDGIADLLLGARRSDSGDTDAGAAFLFAGPITADFSPSDAVFTAIGGEPGGGLGRAIDLRGDLDGDGIADVAAGAYLVTLNAEHGGAVFTFSGGRTGSLSVGDASAKLGDEHEGASFGRALISRDDLDGDGQPDLFVGAPGSGDGQSGAAYAFSSPAGAVDTTGAFVAIAAAEAGDWSGYSLTTGDLDGDGAMDFIVGRPGDHGDNENTTLPGKVCVVYGPRSGVVDRCDLTLTGEGPGDSFGISVDAAILGGETRLVVGAYGASAVYVF